MYLTAKGVFESLRLSCIRSKDVGNEYLMGDEEVFEDDPVIQYI